VTSTGLPPGPRWPVALQTLRFGLDPYALFESAQRTFGDVFTVRVMAETWVILAHPDAVRELYGHGPDELDSGVANMSLRPLLGTQNLLLLDVDRFLNRRPPAGAWLPFGGGVRRCVGAALAQFEARTVLDEVTRALELRPAGRPSRRVGRRGIVLVPARGGPVVAAPR
jgi:cytochrome P450